MKTFPLLRFLPPAALLAATLPSALADDAPKARIDFLLRDGVEVEVAGIHGEGGEVNESSWSGSRTLVSTFPATRIWQGASITLLPRGDGRITVLPMGEHAERKKKTPSFILYDSFRSSDDSLKNGSFESLDPKNDPAWWNHSDHQQLDPAHKAEVIASTAQDGARCIRVWHDSKYVQTIPVKAGVAVTITFQYRAE